MQSVAHQIIIKDLVKPFWWVFFVNVAQGSKYLSPQIKQKSNLTADNIYKAKQNTKAKSKQNTKKS